MNLEEFIKNSSKDKICILFKRIIKEFMLNLNNMIEEETFMQFYTYFDYADIEHWKLSEMTMVINSFMYIINIKKNEEFPLMDYFIIAHCIVNNTNCELCEYKKRHGSCEYNAYSVYNNIVNTLYSPRLSIDENILTFFGKDHFEKVIKKIIDTNLFSMDD